MIHPAKGECLVDGITILCKQYEQRKLREVLEGCPELAHTISQKAKKYGGEIPLRLVFLHTEKEPYYNPYKNAIVVNN